MRSNVKRQRKNKYIFVPKNMKIAAEEDEVAAIMLHVNPRNGNQIESHRYQIKLSCIVAMRYDDAVNVNLQCTNTPCNKIILAFFSHHTFTHIVTHIAHTYSLFLYLTHPLHTYDSITTRLISSHSLTLLTRSLVPSTIINNFTSHGILIDLFEWKREAFFNMLNTSIYNIVATVAFHTPTHSHKYIKIRWKQWIRMWIEIWNWNRENTHTHQWDTTQYNNITMRKIHKHMFYSAQWKNLSTS